MSNRLTPAFRWFATGFSFIVFVALACNSPLSGVDTNAVGTSAAQTVTAEFVHQTETAQAGPTSTSTLIPTQPLASPTNTVAAAVTDTLLPPPDTAVPVPGNPTIVGREDTNCRMGPAPEYPRTGFLLKGQTSTVVGRHTNNTWWYIEDPRKPGEFCWVWGQTTQVTGDTALLPVITPPPPPVLNPDFTAFFAGLNFCGNPAAIFEVRNIGGALFRSVQLSIEDLDLNLVVHDSVRNAPFFPNPGACPPGSQHLAPGEVKYIGGVVDNIVGSGDQGGAYILLCTENNLGGQCVDDYVNFFFP